MHFGITEDLRTLLVELDGFIESEIVPLQAEDDNQRFFDHRREWARTDFEAGGLPRPEWRALLTEMRRRADKAGLLRRDLPAVLGGAEASNLEMAVVREHLAHRGLGLHNDLQDESSVVGNFPSAHLVWRFGSDEQRAQFGEPLVTGERSLGFALTEPEHGSDATWMATAAVRSGGDWVINGEKRWNTGVDTATHDLVFARTSGRPGDAVGISAFIVPIDAPGVEVGLFRWTFNMPTDHADVALRDVRVPDSAILGEEGQGLEVAQAFVHENRIRQAASSLGAAQYCIDRSVAYARERVTFGQPLAMRQAVQWPLVELHTDATMLRMLVRGTAQDLDQGSHMEVSDLVSMCNYRANRLVCEAADRAMQVHGGMGYSRHLPFEHIYRHHRRYRITEGAEEIQMRKVAGHLFGLTGRRK
ncbi:acyl-CoA dehydrogenase domain protein [Streptomyces bingchenggensis BCW-1]|uniref:Acyl-CoA dehydrogenase domain protein n=1 Tax=Streptomyces bingchenggensis (strain BCW-1) TaxID=749414 RepID=D7BW69_STRBB|nr:MULTISPECIES: acyl-CoA dehydrogenase family protein [Streptomyces]ADI11779.1 acyl-CoA dehydrogenase domain protein [Streptomyces bingchenggensis BCW-1]